ncbi:hypothetical protein [Persicobacter psychrovividus]|uniref:3-hydroxymyristoyl/3-hydroxydecanoyl-(Acyl carrier protein) dehydratase n=1 Tax=Persicobacter psychrovividus TaxID=387638 RepID=A0ABM7VMC4_9BACT|nr:hypothetical protein PEPS_44170 [Persicobacter psychrovividus]
MISLNSAVTDFIPQRAPFIFIDRLVKADEQMTKTEFSVPYQHIFVADGQLIEEGLIENMAQTAAAGVGYRQLSEGREVGLGFIGAVQKMIIHQAVPAGSSIYTVVREETTFAGVHLISAEVYDSQEDHLIANAQLKIFLKENG